MNKDNDEIKNREIISLIPKIKIALLDKLDEDEHIEVLPTGDMALRYFAEASKKITKESMRRVIDNKNNKK